MGKMEAGPKPKHDPKAETRISDRLLKVPEGVPSHQEATSVSIKRPRTEKVKPAPIAVEPEDLEYDAEAHHPEAEFDANKTPVVAMKESKLKRLAELRDEIFFHDEDSREDQDTDEVVPAVEAPFREATQEEAMQIAAGIEAHAHGLADQQKLFAVEVRKRAQELGLDEALADTLKDRWYILKKIGQGGMGAVYDTYDFRLRRPSVVKFVVSAHGHQLNPRLAERFDIEKNSLGQYASSRVARAYDAGRTESGAWLAMEKINGESLFDEMRRGPFKAAEFKKAGIQIAQALQEVHRQHRIHRDIKPGNIMHDREADQYKVVDFGLAKDLEYARDRQRWLERLMRSVLSGERSLNALPISHKDQKALSTLLEFAKDKQIRKQFIEGKVTFDDFDESFKEKFAAVAQAAELKGEAPIELMIDTNRDVLQQNLAEEIIRFMKNETVRQSGVVASTEKLIETLRRDAYLMTAIDQGRRADAIAYVSQMPEIRTRAEKMLVENLRDTGITEAGQALGTPHYMSPEQFAGAEVDEKSDIWALGVTFFEMLTGKVPFTASSARAIAEKVQQEPAPEITRPDVPQEIIDLVKRMLEKDPAKRPTTAEIMAILQSVELKRPKPSVKRRKRAVSEPSWFERFKKLIS